MLTGLVKALDGLPRSQARLLGRLAGGPRRIRVVPGDAVTPDDEDSSSAMKRRSSAWPGRSGRIPNLSRPAPSGRMRTTCSSSREWRARARPICSSTMSSSMRSGRRVRTRRGGGGHRRVSRGLGGSRTQACRRPARDVSRSSPIRTAANSPAPSFDAMVREILDDTFALFALSGFRKGIARGAGRRPPPIARLEFVRSRIAEA